jgi:hypothetical protein
MSSNGWSIVGNVSNVQTLAAATATGAAAATHIYQNRRQNVRSQLDKCYDELSHIETCITRLTPDERERLRIAAHQGKCSSLEKIQRELDK